MRHRRIYVGSVLAVLMSLASGHVTVSGRTTRNTEYTIAIQDGYDKWCDHQYYPINPAYVVCNSNTIGSDELWTLTDLNGGTLWSGDIVSIRVENAYLGVSSWGSILYDDDYSDQEFYIYTDCDCEIVDGYVSLKSVSQNTYWDAHGYNIGTSSGYGSYYNTFEIAFQ